MKPKYSFCLLLFFLLMGSSASQLRAQDWAIKSNIVYDATATINLGVEIGLAPKWTLDVSGNLNAWSKDENTRWKHWLVNPRHAIGSATASHATSSEHTPLVVHSTSAA